VGDALQMARKVGARLVGMENVYGHLLCQDALHDDRLWPYPILDLIAGAGIVVDGTGSRIGDEGLGGVYLTNCVARLADPLCASVVFDRAIWDGPATEFILPANPNLVKAGGTIVGADTLEALAGKLGVPAPRLAHTVAAYNAAVDAGTTAGLKPPRTLEKSTPHPIRVAPFYAVRIAAGITYTMGGPATDERGRVLDAADAPIPGLYAVGCATGGLDGGPAAGYVSGLTKSAVMGLRAADHVAAARAARGT
jgi:fumarate reductase flavoprotein subunit